MSFNIKDISFNCQITQEYIHDLLSETFDYQNTTAFKGKDDKYNWIYMIINKKNGHFFIGTRSKSNLLNSINISRLPELKADVETLGADTFSRFDLCYYQTYEEMMAVVADQFGDEFISVFSELGTCYNTMSYQADEDIKIDDDVNSIANITLPIRKRGYKHHHFMKKDDTQTYVENEKCLSFLEKGFRFVAKTITIYRMIDLSVRSMTIKDKQNFKGYDYDSYEKRRNHEILLLLKSGWSLSTPAISEQIQRKKVKPGQLTLNFEKPTDKSKSSLPAVRESNGLRSATHFLLKKDDKLQPVFIEDVKSYLAQGYHFEAYSIVLVNGNKKRHIGFKCRSQNSLLSNVDYAKMRSMEVLFLLESGWEFEKRKRMGI